MQLRSKALLASVAAGAVLVGTGMGAFAAGDTEDHFNVPAGTVVKGSGTFSGSGVFGGVPITLTCTSVTAQGKTPLKGLAITLPKPPTISGCTDTLGGTDTITTSGKWKIAEKDVANDETQTEPNTGDKSSLTIPQGGATFSSSLDPACVVTVAPTGAVTIRGTYNDAGKLVITNATIPVSPNSSCPSGTGSTAQVSSTINLTPAIYDVS